MRLLTFVIVFFLLELFLIVMAAVDYGWVIFWIEVGTAILGAFLIKRAGAHLLREHGDPPFSMHEYMAISSHTAQISLAGLFLLLPGFITDILGTAILLSPLRLMAMLFRLSSRKRGKHQETMRGPRIIDSEVESSEKPPDKP